MKKKLMALLCAAAMTVSLAACGAGTDTTYAGQTLTGRVTAMDGTAVTLALGELSEDAAPAGGASSDNDSQQSPEKPEGESGSQSDGGTTIASDLIVTTSGNSSAAIRSDRGGGTWTLTGDCVITSLTNNGTINFNGYTITLADGTVLQ